MKSTCGVIYIATGEDYINEAIKSVKSLKDNVGDLSVTLYSDIEVDSNCFNKTYKLDNKRGDYGDSIISPEMLEYDRNLFLDSDTYVKSDIMELFTLLDRFDIGASHNPGSRITDPDYGVPAKGVPKSFPLYNTGVLVMKRNEIIKRLLSDWQDIYDRKMNMSESQLNQPAFREALYNSNAKVATLPTEYNCRIQYRGTAGFLADEVKIVHGRHSVELLTIAEVLNNYTGPRVFTFKKYPLEIKTSSPSLRFYIRTLLSENMGHYTYKSRFINSIQKRGIHETTQRVLRDIKRSIFN